MSGAMISRQEYISRPSAEHDPQRERVVHRRGDGVLVGALLQVGAGVLPGADAVAAVLGATTARAQEVPLDVIAVPTLDAFDLVRELRQLARLTYTAMLIGLVLLVLPLLPHVGQIGFGVANVVPPSLDTRKLIWIFVPTYCIQAS